MPTRSQPLIDILKNTVQADITSNNSVIQYFLTHNVRGGWEVWLQTVYARRVFGVYETLDFQREVNYTGSQNKCDLWFKSDTMIQLWVELKTQRNSRYTNTASDFSDDIDKVNAFDGSLDTNTLVALAVLLLATADRPILNTLRNAYGSKIQYMSWDSRPQVWRDVTAGIATQPVGSLLLATYKRV